ncbi:hypothetical protein [Leptospira noguchii]|uniref:hypothetical protein n=1 Tax=Leptospira noguchii TaxID=28182 RepID=UPI001FB6937E|nr:hypothetical protein [Leptospira noguchii]UOG28976.1 hypothetical protein MAL06_09595 [Leptospira noguchii]
MLTIFISAIFGALISLLCVFLIKLYADFKIKQLLKFAPEPFVFSKEEEERLKRETIENFTQAPGDLAFKLEGFLKSLEFHDQLLDRMFQSDIDCEDHLAIASTLAHLMQVIESKITNLRQGT